MTHEAGEVEIEKFDLRYCVSCLNSNLRPNSNFGADGICSACNFAEKNRQEYFPERLRELQSIVSKLKGNRRAAYGAIVGVSGGKDSTRQALWVRERLGIEPLLVSVSYPPRQLTPTGAKNLSNLVELGFDCERILPAPKASRELFRHAFLQFGNAFIASEMALFGGVQKIALDRGVPLVLWGENPALQVGDFLTLGDSIWDGNNLRNMNTLSGGNYEWIRQLLESEGLMWPYSFPSIADMEGRVDTVFLGPAWDNWSQLANAETAFLHGFHGSPLSTSVSGDFLGVGAVDDELVIINFYLKYAKFGFSRGTEVANDLIRGGKITREKGIEIAQELDPQLPESVLRDFLNYASISLQDFHTVVERFYNRDLFAFEAGNLIPRFTVGQSGTLRDSGVSQ